MHGPIRLRASAYLAPVALALVVGLVPVAAHAAFEAEAQPAEGAGGAQLALEFGEPDPDPEHAEPDDQRVLEDPAGWPWWVWALILAALVAVGVPLATWLMRRVERVRSGSGGTED